MIYLCISMTVTVEAVLSLGVGSSTALLSVPGVVCDDWGRPRIPGGQICTKARHAAEVLANNLGLRPAEGRGQPDVVASVFGMCGQPAPLCFADLPGVPGLPELRQRQFRSAALERRHAASAPHLLLDEPALEGTLFHSARAITGTLEGLPQLGLLWAALRMAASWGGAGPHDPPWAALDLEVRYDADGPPDLSAPSLDPVALGQMLRRLARHG